MQDSLRQAAVLVLLAAGAYLTVKARFFQMRPPFVWLLETLRSLRVRPQRGGVSPLQGVCTALAATIGTGNIAGVAAAIAVGGPGAVFWMWLGAVLGMMTAFAENALGALYAGRGRATGPMAYLEYGLKSPPLAGIYAFLCVLASFGIGNLCQANAAALSLKSAFGIPCIRTGTVLAVLAAVVIMGGVRSVAAFSEKAVPLMAGLYLLGCLGVLACRLTCIPGAIMLILRSAFVPRAAVGGTAGGLLVALRVGILRGIFSNEAGLGTTVLAHAPTGGQNPVRQGMWGMFEVLADTLVICTMTALTILVSGVYPGAGDGLTLAGSAFSTVYGAAGQKGIALMLALFAFTTVVAWCSYGIQCIRYMAGRPGAVLVYKLLFVCALLPAALLDSQSVWETSDVLNSLLVFPNLAAVLLLSGQSLRLLREEKALLFR